MSESIEQKLPAAFCARMKDLLGNEYPAFLSSYEREMQRGLRINPIKADADAVLAALSDLPLRPIPYFSYGYFLC